jgi:hypothetical protein
VRYFGWVCGGVKDALIHGFSSTLLKGASQRPALAASGWDKIRLEDSIKPKREKMHIKCGESHLSARCVGGQNLMNTLTIIGFTTIRKGLMNFCHWAGVIVTAPWTQDEKR